MDEREPFTADEEFGRGPRPNVNETEGKTPLAWNDEHLKLFPGVKYEQITDNELLRRIGENWFIMLYQNQSAWLPELTTLLALHLRTFGKDIICDPKDQDDNISDQKQDLTFLVNVTTLQKIEDITGRKHANQGTAEGKATGSLVIEGLTEAETAQCVFYKVITQLREVPTFRACACYSFFAAVASRVMIKDESKVAKNFSSSSQKKQTSEFCGVDVDVLPQPQVSAFKSIKSQISAKVKGPLYIGLLKAFLKASTRERGSYSCGVLNYTLLVHTKMNGLHLIDLLIKAKEHMYSQKINEVFKESYCEKTAPGISLLTTFLIKYYSVSQEEQQKYVLWSRLFDDAYFCNMRIAEHRILAAFLITIAKEDENDPIWNIPALKISGRRKKKFIEAGRIWRSQRRRFGIQFCESPLLADRLRQSDSSNSDQEETLASILGMAGHK